MCLLSALSALREIAMRMRSVGKGGRADLLRRPHALYAAWNAIANLADLADRVKVTIRAESEKGFDSSKLQNGVLEPLREVDLID